MRTGTWFIWRQEVNIGNRKAILADNGKIIGDEICTKSQLEDIKLEFAQYDALREMNS